jgi:hypothetical protein
MTLMMNEAPGRCNRLAMGLIFQLDTKEWKAQSGNFREDASET